MNWTAQNFGLCLIMASCLSLLFGGAMLLGSFIEKVALSEDYEESYVAERIQSYYNRAIGAFIATIICGLTGAFLMHSDLDTTGWHSRPFVKPAMDRTQAEVAARAYMTWEIGQGMTAEACEKHETSFYQSPDECGYGISYGWIHIPQPCQEGKPQQYWKFRCVDLMHRPQQYELPL